MEIFVIKCILINFVENIYFHIIKKKKKSILKLSRNYKIYFKKKKKLLDEKKIPTLEIIIIKLTSNSK